MSRLVQVRLKLMKKLKLQKQKLIMRNAERTLCSLVHINGTYEHKCTQLCSLLLTHPTLVIYFSRQ